MPLTRRPGRFTVILAAIAATVIAVMAVFLLWQLRGRELQHAEGAAVSLSHIIAEQTTRSLQGVDLALDIALGNTRLLYIHEPGNMLCENLGSEDTRKQLQLGAIVTPDTLHLDFRAFHRAVPFLRVHRGGYLPPRVLTCWRDEPDERPQRQCPCSSHLP